MPRKWDLSALRVACVGAEMINPEPLQRFAEALAPAGFKSTAFLPCYGMAECSLGISFAGLDEELKIDYVDAENMQHDECGRASRPRGGPEGKAPRRALRRLWRCCPASISRSATRTGNDLPERHTGVVHLRGPSVMSRYFREEAMTRETLSEDGWLNTGDIGYMADGRLFVTGRKKDMIIIHGRNIWPEDLEYIAKTQPGMNYTDAAAFSVPSEKDQQETAVLVVQCRERDEIKRARLVKTIASLVRSEYGIDCIIELVPTRTLPRTSSGKLARARARLDFLGRRRAAARRSNPRPSTPRRLTTTGHRSVISHEHSRRRDRCVRLCRAGACRTSARVRAAGQGAGAPAALAISHPDLVTVTGGLSDAAALGRLMEGPGRSSMWPGACVAAMTQISCPSMPRASRASHRQRARRHRSRALS